MKFKWNWLDTTIVAIVAILVIGAAAFFLWPRNEVQVDENGNVSKIFITLDTEKAPIGTYDGLNVGDELTLTSNGKVLGTVVDVQILPSRNSVFDESAKKINVFENKTFPFCRFVIEAEGYISDTNEAYVSGQPVMYRDELVMETTSIRLVAKVSGVKGDGNNE